MGIMENTKQLTVKNCVKYLIFAGVIYGVLKIVPTQKLTNIEMTILIIIILLGIFSLDCLTVSKQNKEGMSNAKKIFDLDLDVDLDFNKASSDYKETNTDIKTTESNESVISEKGINLDEVKKELNKKASAKKSVIDSEISTDSFSSIEEKTESDTDEKETEEVEKEKEEVEKEKVEKKKEQVKKEKEEKKEELKKKISEKKKKKKKNFPRLNPFLKKKKKKKKK